MAASAYQSEAADRRCDWQRPRHHRGISILGGDPQQHTSWSHTKLLTDHARSENVSSSHETERQLGSKPDGLANLNGLKVLQTFFRFSQRVQRQRRIVFRNFSLVVKIRVFFLQVTGIGQDDSA